MFNTVYLPFSFLSNDGSCLSHDILFTVLNCNSPKLTKISSYTLLSGIMSTTKVQGVLLTASLELATVRLVLPGEPTHSYWVVLLLYHYLLIQP